MTWMVYGAGILIADMLFAMLVGAFLRAGSSAAAIRIIDDRRRR